MKKTLLFAVAMLAGIMSAAAFDTTPFQLGIWPPKYQIVPDAINVSGLKINLPFGGNGNIQGVDLGLASTSDTTSAFQVNVLVNRAHDDFSGLQFALVNQSGNASGIILGGLNITDDKTKGLQIGIINSSTATRGVQIGIVNYTEAMVGVQVGLVNVITESVVPFFPIINFCF